MSRIFTWLLVIVLIVLVFVVAAQFKPSPGVVISSVGDLVALWVPFVFAFGVSIVIVISVGLKSRKG